MNSLVSFIINSALLGVGLAMDAFSVSVANGLQDPAMPRKRAILIAGTFGFFQFLMPMLGWFCVHAIVEALKAMERFIPWIAFILLAWIGGSMITEAVRGKNCSQAQANVSLRILFVQGIATSIDALSTGFAFAEYDLSMAFAASAIISAVTFALCMTGIRIGKIFGLKLTRHASAIGGVILLCIGLEILWQGIAH